MAYFYIDIEIELISPKGKYREPLTSPCHPFMIGNISNFTTSSMLIGLKPCPHEFPNTRLRAYKFNIFYVSL